MNSDEDFDSILEDDSVLSDPKSLKSARVPTVPELNAQITRLERENFQLRLRVHMNETKGSIEPITSSTATVPKKSQREIRIQKDVEVLRVEKEQLECKLHQKQSQLLQEIKIKEEALHREACLQNKIEEMKTYISICEREKALNRLHSGPTTSPYLTSPILSTLTVNPGKVNKNHEVQLPLDGTGTDWYKKYNKVCQKLQSKENEVAQIQRELEIVKNDRLQLANAHEKELEAVERQFKEQIEGLKQETAELKATNEQLQASVQIMERRMETLTTAANLELSNQLFYHQTALEKVHHEQALLIAELQNLKRSCPIQKPVKEFYKKAELIDIEGEPDSPKMLEFTEVLKPQIMSGQGSEDTSDCLIDLNTPRFKGPLKNPPCVDREEKISMLNKELEQKNSKLAIKLMKTKESLKRAISMLEHSEKDKEGMEKIICRQLHRTHMILVDVKGALAQNQPNIMSKTDISIANPM